MNRHTNRNAGLQSCDYGARNGPYQIEKSSRPRRRRVENRRIKESEEKLNDARKWNCNIQILFDKQSLKLVRIPVAKLKEVEALADACK